MINTPAKAQPTPIPAAAPVLRPEEDELAPLVIGAVVGLLPVDVVVATLVEDVDVDRDVDRAEVDDTVDVDLVAALCCARRTSGAGA